jgi:ribosome maturation factor RimP
MLNERINHLAQHALSNEAHFLVDVIVSSNRGPTKITVVLDGDQGISIDDCSAVSRSISKGIEDENLINENYTLEVTTPGLDQPLKLNRQYRKNKGRELRVHLKDKKIIEGLLKEATDIGIILEYEAKEGKRKDQNNIELAYKDIVKSFVKISFK